MNRFLTSVKFTLIVLFILCLPPFRSSEAQVVIGGNDSASAYPFGTNFVYTGQYQQLYRSGAFGGPITIGGIDFASSSLYSQPDDVSYDVTIGLSTTNASLDAPSEVYAENRGADYTTVFSGNVTASLTATDSFDLNIPLTTPFAYDPANGNLLLDVTVNSASGSQTNFFVSSDSSPDVSRIFNLAGDGPPTVQTQSGLLTRFDPPAPGGPNLTLLDSLTWGSSGTANFQMNDAAGVAGPTPPQTGWSLIEVANQVNITATPTSLFQIALQSYLVGGNGITKGDALNFDPTVARIGTNGWLFVSAGGGVDGFDPSAFTFDTSGFTNDLKGGTFSLSLENGGHDLYINFTPAGVPESSALLTAGLLLATGNLLLRRRLRCWGYRAHKSDDHSGQPGTARTATPGAFPRSRGDDRFDL